jgi:hypothetical protein
MLAVVGLLNKRLIIGRPNNLDIQSILNAEFQKEHPPPPLASSQETEGK